MSVPLTEVVVAALPSAALLRPLGIVLYIGLFGTIVCDDPTGSCLDRVE